MRGIKKRKSKLKPECSADFETSASGSVKERQESASSVRDTVEKVSRCFPRANFVLLLFFICLSKYFNYLMKFSIHWANGEAETVGYIHMYLFGVA